LIHSFDIVDKSCAFCMLCSALDAITGNNKNRLTKKRMAKYSSILFCQPKKLTENKKRIEDYYKKRSDFVHGRKNKITFHDEVSLREFVNLFLLSYYLIHVELNIKYEYQMLQKLDDICNNHELYTKLIPCSYSYLSTLNEYLHNQGALAAPFKEQFYVTL